MQKLSGRMERPASSRYTWFTMPRGSGRANSGTGQANESHLGSTQYPKIRLKDKRVCLQSLERGQSRISVGPLPAGQDFAACRDLCACRQTKRADFPQPLAHGIRLAAKVLSGRKGPTLTIIRDYTRLKFGKHPMLNSDGFSKSVFADHLRNSPARVAVNIGNQDSTKWILLKPP